MKIDEKILLEKISKIDSWDEWNDFEERFFNEDTLERKSNDEWELGLNRDDQIIDGITWHATSINYKNLHAYYLYEKSRRTVFAKLEPEAAAENAAHPEWYGQICYHCEIWRRSHKPKACSVCGGELLPFTLNEDDD